MVSTYRLAVDVPTRIWPSRLLKIRCNVLDIIHG
jgi:hypothetical protein